MLLLLYFYLKSYSSVCTFRKQEEKRKKNQNVIRIDGIVSVAVYTQSTKTFVNVMTFFYTFVKMWKKVPFQSNFEM